MGNMLILYTGNLDLILDWGIHCDLDHRVSGSPELLDPH